ncbi:hypothetical protein Dsin_009373 [Dipteronia sinensis]|uniref:Reverse transcriptase zinc-binding domain-containing protein n=1 Tax=Dipteronia sinensis TaxID=43782 RepID=A0AAE0AQU4_9ROSI|nr:hypothetical protein Dsin_009373 [Dipteronia sinensis]
MASSDTRPSTSGHQSMESCWISVWRLLMPPKVDIFLRRACKNWIPTRVNLVRRKIPVGAIYPICNRYQETIMHALWGCLNMEEVRKQCGFVKGLRSETSVDFKAFLAFCSQNLHGNELPLFSNILWRIWFLQNQKIHGTSELSISNVYSWSYDFFILLLGS